MNSTNRFKHPPLVYIIILNWNQAQLTIECLRSLQEITYPNYRVILVDNGSRDRSVSLVRASFPDIQIIENKENMGFSEANNIGIRCALDQGAEYVLLLNNDTAVDPVFVDELIAVAESNPKIGMVGPKTYYYDQPDTIWCTGASIDWHNGKVASIRENEKDTRPEERETKKVDYLPACAVAVKREVLEKVGLLDPRFFIYFDESDWCARTTAAGYDNVYVSASKIWHKVSAVMGVGSPLTDYYMTRNVLLFLAKNLRGMPRVAAISSVLLQNTRSILAFTLLKKNRDLKNNRNAKFIAIRDALSGAWGKVSEHSLRSFKRA